MTTDVLNEEEAVAAEPAEEETVAVEPAEEEIDLRAELESLLAITSNKISRGDLTPCPACTILVDIKANDCPHCNSYIAPNNALMRESLRRINEIRAELDGEHAEVVERHRGASAPQGFWERFRHFFSGSEPVQEPPKSSIPQPDGPRILDSVSPGDALKVIEYDHPWYKIKTRDGRTGWIYSTLAMDR